MKNIKVLTLHHAPTKKKEVNWPYLFCARKCLEYIPENFREQSIAVGEEFFVISLCLWSVNASLKNDLELLSKNSHFEKGPLCGRGTYTATTSACMHPMCVPPEIFKYIAIWNDVIFNQIILWCGFIKNLLASFCWLIIWGWRLFIPQSQGEWGYWNWGSIKTTLSPLTHLHYCTLEMMCFPTKKLIQGFTSRPPFPVYCSIFPVKIKDWKKLKPFEKKL